VLALILMIGGVTGAQIGARSGEKMSAERLRFLLGILVLGVCVRFAFDIVIEPRDLFSIRTIGESGV
ncbi:MAG: sulfite exporter TauE/SafE family protein, partial [Rhizobiales bacterium]|nr:sulfite exporter TauE/SafE family protein [Hyphomicrobiales bacterium]